MTRLCAVYGASRGIGRAIANKFYREGYHVAILSRNHERLEAVAAEIAEQNSGDQQASIKAFTCDVTQPDQILQSVESLKSSFNKPVDVLVNCAGVLHTKLLLSTSDDVIRDEIATNLVGTINVCRAHLKGMLRERNGAIICVGSTAAVAGLPGQSVYAATKSALSGFSRSLAAEVASRNITVNVIAPGFTETDMTSSVSDDVIRRIPLGRMGRPEEVADLVKFVAECRYMTGQTIYLDGGITAVR